MGVPVRIKEKMAWEGTTVQFRKAEKEVIRKLAKQQGLAVNAFIRQAVITYIEDILWSDARTGSPYLQQYFAECKKNPTAVFDGTKLESPTRQELGDIDDIIAFFKMKVPSGAPKKRRGHHSIYQDS